MVLSLPSAPTSRASGKFGGLNNAGMQAGMEAGALQPLDLVPLMFWHVYEDAARFREWLSHRRTRAMRARLEALADRYAGRSKRVLILIIDDPDRYDIKRYRCNKNTALVKLYVCWEELLREHKEREAEKIRALYMN